MRRYSICRWSIFLIERLQNLLYLRDIIRAHQNIFRMPHFLVDENMNSTAINFSDIDSDVDRLSKSLDKFRLLGKTMSARWALDFLCWGAALRIEGMTKDLQSHFSALKSLKERLEQGNFPPEAIDEDFSLSNHILMLEERVSCVATKLQQFRLKVRLEAKHTINSIDRSLAAFSQIYDCTSSIRWEIGTHDAAFLGRAENLSGDSAEDIQKILEKINAVT